MRPVQSSKTLNLKLLTLNSSLLDFERVLDGALAVAKLAITHAKQDGAAVALTGYVAHVNERGIEDELVVVNALIQDDEAESLDEQFPTSLNL